MQTMHYYNRSAVANTGGEVGIGTGLLSAEPDYRQIPSYHSYAAAMSSSPDATALPFHQHHYQQQFNHNSTHHHNGNGTSAHITAGSSAYPELLPSPSPSLATRVPSGCSNGASELIPRGAENAPRPPSALYRERIASESPATTFGNHHQLQHQHQLHPNHQQQQSHHCGQNRHSNKPAVAIYSGIDEAQTLPAYGIASRGYSAAFNGGYRPAGGVFNQYGNADAAVGQLHHQQQHRQHQQHHVQPSDAAHAYDNNGGNLNYPHQQQRQHHHQSSHMYPNQSVAHSFYGPHHPNHPNHPKHPHQQYPHQNLHQHQPNHQHAQHSTQHTENRLQISAGSISGLTEIPNDGAHAYPSQPPPPPQPPNSHHFHQLQQHQQQQPQQTSPSQYYASDQSSSSQQLQQSQLQPATPTGHTMTATTPQPAGCTAAETTSQSNASKMYGADAVVKVPPSSASSPAQSPPTEAPSIDAAAVAEVRSGRMFAAGSASANAAGDDANHVESNTSVGSTDTTATASASEASAAFSSIMSPRGRIECDSGVRGIGGVRGVGDDGNVGGSARGGNGDGSAAAAAAKHGSIAARNVDEMVEVTSSYPTPPPSAVPQHHQATDHHAHDTYNKAISKRNPSREKNLSKMAAMNRKLETDSYYGSSSPMYEMDRGYASNMTNAHIQRLHPSRHPPYMMDQHHHHQHHHHILSGPYFHAQAHHHHHQQHHQYHHQQQHQYAHHNPYARYGGAYPGHYGRAQIPSQLHSSWSPMSRSHVDWAHQSAHHIGGVGLPYAAYRRAPALLPANIQLSSAPDPSPRKRLGRPPARENHTRPNSGVFESDVIPSKKKRKLKADVDNKEPVTKPPTEMKVVTPLPGFQQAFGSTEIGRFSEMFFNSPESRLEHGAFGIDFEPDTLSPPAFALAEIGDTLEGSQFYMPSGSSSVHSMNAESYTSTGSPASSLGYFGETRSMEYC